MCEDCSTLKMKWFFARNKLTGQWEITFPISLPVSVSASFRPKNKLRITYPAAVLGWYTNLCNRLSCFFYGFSF